MIDSRIVVGAEVFLKPINNNARYGNEKIEKYVIKKIGRKYFEVWQDNRAFSIEKFHIDGFKQCTEYSSDWQLYFSEQEILDERERDELLRQVRMKIGAYGESFVSLEKLRKIKAILEVE